MIRFKCPGCLNLHTANPSFAGLTARCTRCGERMWIPAGRPASEPDGDADDSDFLLEPGEVSDTEEAVEAGTETPRPRRQEESADQPDEDEPAPTARSKAWMQVTRELRSASMASLNSRFQKRLRRMPQPDSAQPLRVRSARVVIGNHPTPTARY